MKNSIHTLSRGFTLLEILVAMSIFTLIGLASASVITSVIVSDKLSSERFQQLETLQRSMLTIERDIMQTMPRATRINGEIAKTVLLGGEGVLNSDADGIAFIRGGWHNPQLLLPRSTLQAVGYRIQENQLQRVYGNYVDNVIGYEPKVKVLLTDIEDFQITFLTDSKNLDEANLWQEEYSAETLPSAVSITIVSKTFGEIHRDFILVTGS